MATWNHIEQLRSAVRVTGVDPPWAFTWFWEREVLFPRSLRRALLPETARAHLVHVLEQRLYSHFYCTGGAVPKQASYAQNGNAPPASSKVAFTNELSAANNGGGYSDDSWQAIRLSGDVITIEKNGLRLHVDKDDSFVHGSGSIRSGMPVLARMPKELRFLTPGFYLAMGDRLLPSGDDAPIVRFYWNLRPEGAVILMRSTTMAFNRDRLPFRLKVFGHPGQFTRCDAAVLYILKEHYSRARTMLEAIYSEAAPYLKAGTPAFTKSLGRGLGMAEAPRQGASFGLHRCRILAEGLVRAAESGGTSVEDRLPIVLDWLAEQRVSPERPFLNPGSEDVFGFAAEIPPPKGMTASPRSQDRAINRQMLLATAFGIGALLSARAVWHNGRCNWLGMRLFGNDAPHEDSSDLAYQALGPEVYGGTSGVALFLAELHVSTGDADMRRTALGAIRQAVSAASRSSPPAGLGLYEGVLGIALTAAYIGRLLGEEDLLDSARRFVRDALHQEREDRPADLVSGKAGAILALLILKDLLRDITLADFAERLGSEVLRSADRKAGHASWGSRGSPGQRNLLGFSHGTAGIGYALLELYGLTANEEYRESAEAAFNYERFWFNPNTNNWPDFRGVPARPGTLDYGVECPVFWCHGAAGIALSRLRAYRLLRDDRYRSEALTALTTTSQWTARILATGFFSFSLCHGLAGNADILATGSEILSEAFPSGRELAMEVAAKGIREYGERQHRWPFDLLGSKSPGLMLGLSGVGHFYLRLYDPTVPSALFLERRAFLRRSNCDQ